MNSIDFQEYPNNQFAIIYIETTGSFPRKGDRIVEIAIQTVNWNGEIIDFYETLVNPGVEITGQVVHGINNEMVESAPSLKDIAPQMIQHLNGKTIVAHNMDFLHRFLSVELPEYFNREENQGICTLQLSQLVEEDFPLRRLERICEYYDIDISKNHTARTDCIATAKLFSILKNEFIADHSMEEFVQQFVKPVHFEETIPIPYLSLKREEAQEQIRLRREKLFELLNRLNSFPGASIPVQQYLNVLDRALADRILTEKEAHCLFELASEYEISKQQAMDIHEEYLRKLTRVYLLDEILSKEEMSDLQLVAELLCIETKDLEQIIEFEKASISVTFPNPRTDVQFLVGKSVCFAGHLHCKINGKKIERTIALQLANERGLVVKRVVSKNLDYLVVTDPEQYSAKGKKGQKAMEYNVKVLAEETFWEMIGVKVDSNSNKLK